MTSYESVCTPSIDEVKRAVEQINAFMDDSSPVLQNKNTLSNTTTEFIERQFQHAPRKEPWVLSLTVENTTEKESKKLQAAIIGRPAFFSKKPFA
jgi:hypothetical protein